MIANSDRHITLEDHAETLEAMRSELDLVPSSCAVVTVDMHRGHLDPVEATFPVPVEERERVMSGTKKLLSIARRVGLPVVHVTLALREVELDNMSPRYEPRRLVLSPETPQTAARRRGDRHNLIGSVQAELMPELRGDGDHVIDTKKTASAFLWTDLDHLLTVLGVDTILLAGINTNTCVQCTAFDAANLSYRPVVVRECVASMYGRDLHMAALENIARCVGWVVGICQLEAKLASAESPRSPMPDERIAP